MKKMKKLWVLATFFIALHACSQMPAAYQASTPCSPGTKPLPGIPKDAPCELIKWKLVLQQHTYQLDAMWGMPKQGTRGFINGGTAVHRQGKWAMVKGLPANPAAIVYRLDPDNPATAISFLRLNDNLLHLLDGDGHLMIGTGAWSYTLNKIPQ